MGGVGGVSQKNSGAAFGGGFVSPFTEHHFTAQERQNGAGVGHTIEQCILQNNGVLLNF
jgi:hypothetical protein